MFALVGPHNSQQHGSRQLKVRYTAVSERGKAEGTHRRFYVHVLDGLHARDLRFTSCPLGLVTW